MLILEGIREIIVELDNFCSFSSFKVPKLKLSPQKRETYHCYEIKGSYKNLPTRVIKPTPCVD
jgi:hypothetical protein